MRHHTSAIVAVPPRSQADCHAIIIMIHRSIGVTWSINALGGMFLTLSKLKGFGLQGRRCSSHGPIVLRSPVNGSEAPCTGGGLFKYVQRMSMRATGRVPPVTTTWSHAFSSKFGLSESESKFGLRAWAT
jgi:hypothetical protein